MKYLIAIKLLSAAAGLVAAQGTPSISPISSSDTSTVILPAITTRETVHGICIGGGSFAEASSTQDTLTYSAIDPFTGRSHGWGDRRYTIYGQENTPCADGIFLQSSLHKAINPVTVITITASAGSTICVFLEEVHGGRNGGWLESLPSNGFTNYGLQSDFGWDDAKWTLFCKGPTLKPSASPTLSPSKGPTLKPSASPTLSPTNVPTLKPSHIPAENVAAATMGGIASQSSDTEKSGFGAERERLMVFYPP